MSPQSQSSLVIHDGELADVCAMLAHMSLPFTERRGASTARDEGREWEMVISTPRRLLEFEPAAAGTQPPRVAVLDKDSRTLRSMLQRAGIDLIVRRPVHPEALRLLILYTLYRGPEKRRALRVSVGARIRFRSGFRRRAAVLADLSATGCRLLSSHPVEQGARLRIQIPAEVAAGQGFEVRGTVVRTSPSETPGIDAIAVSFGRPAGRDAARLRAVVTAHGTGPAVLPPGDDACSALAFAAPAPATGLAAAPEPEPGTNPERRSNDRHAYSTRVVALGVEAARVLLGRDISLGGMRVESHPDLAVGDHLSIALHVRAREKPLVVHAEVARDDGDAGLVLHFLQLPPESQDYLRRMIDFLPILAHREGDHESAGVIVSEILERRAAAG